MDRKAYLAGAAALMLSVSVSAQTPGFDAERFVLEQNTSASSDAALRSFRGGEAFGQWQVKLEGDDMSPTTRVHVMTAAQAHTSDGRPLDRFYTFGFTLIDKRLLTIHTSAAGRHYWPYCDSDLASISVDRQPARYLADSDRPGNCGDVALAGITMQQLRAGETARLRFGSQNMQISLEGFSAAMERAISLAR